MTHETLRKEFGFYPQPLQIKAGSVTVSTLPDIERITSDLLASDDVEANWIYPSTSTAVRELISGKVRERPIPLPRVRVAKDALDRTRGGCTSEDHLEFHISGRCRSFVGMRLTTTEAGFLDATPLKRGQLVDFILLGSSLTRAVELAEIFWTTNLAKPRRAQRFDGGSSRTVPRPESAESGVREVCVPLCSD